MSELSELSEKELLGKLKSTRSIQITTGVIFGLIILAWFVLGYWRTNLPVFATTVAMGLAIFGATSVAPQKLKAELDRRSRA